MKDFSASEKKVSVIIPAYNEEGVLGRLLASIKKQTYPNIEIIVIDDRSVDKTAEIAKKYTKKVFTKKKRTERSATRNFGAKKAKGEYLLFLDADMELPPKVIEMCVKEVNKDGKLGAISLSEEPVAKKFWERVKAFERSFYSRKGDKTLDAARFFLHKAFEEAGGYDETITGPEDWDLPETIKKLGYKITWIDAKIKHYENIPSFFLLLKKKYYYGLKSYRYLVKHKIPLTSQKTIYFFRPVFYKNYRKLLSNPILSISMLVMLFCEQVTGGLGYLVGRIKKV